jgi:hypothetical protein
MQHAPSAMFWMDDKDEQVIHPAPPGPPGRALVSTGRLRLRASPNPPFVLTSWPCRRRLRQRDGMLSGSPISEQFGFLEDLSRERG